MNTEVYLINSQLDKDYKHTMYFSSASAQMTYMLQRPHMYFTDFSYQRKDNTMRLPLAYDVAVKYNYVAYRNIDESDKWYYAFIVNYEFRNDVETKITIETDVMQTYLFDYNVLPSFVEREHTDSDKAGEHTIPENLELGEYVCAGLVKDENLTDHYYVVCASDHWLGNDNVDVTERFLVTNFGGVPMPGGAFVTDNMAGLWAITDLYSKNARPDAVYSAYVIPKKMITRGDQERYLGDDKTHNNNKQIPNTETIGSYTPKNKKLLSFPYQYMLMSNNSGISNVLQYENFGGSCAFEVKGVPVVGGSIKCCPKNYKGVAVNEEEGIMCGKFPILAWSSDLYTAWLTQNGLNIGIGIGMGALQIIGGAVMAVASSGTAAAAGGGLIASGVGSIIGQLSQIHQHSFTPDSARGNTNGGDIATCSDANTFYFYKMCIKEEYAKIIDNYFSTYGYKCNRVKMPLMNHRKNWWFTKTIDVNIDSKPGHSIPQADLEKIKNCYNAGITFWKADMGNYNNENDII